MNNTQRLLLFTIAVLVTVGLTIAAVYRVDRTQSNTATAQGIRVAASHAVLAQTAERIGGLRVTMIPLAQQGTEAHDFEPTPKDVAALYDADVFVYNGAGLDAWAEKLAPELTKRGVAVLNLSDELPLREVHEEDEAHTDEHGDEHAAEDHEHHGAHDPHFWLSPVVMQMATREISEAMGQADPANAQYFSDNARLVIQELEMLDAEYQQRLSQCAQREIIAAHDAYGYLGAEYDFTIHAISGISPEAEPSSKHIAELTDLAKTHNIHTIFFESATNTKLAETIAAEVGAKTQVLYPLEGFTKEQQDARATYTSVMQENLAQLTGAMGCTVTSTQPIPDSHDEAVE